MHAPKVFFILAFIFCSLTLNAQDTIHIEMDKKYYPTRGHGYMTLQKYQGKNQIFYSGEAHTIKFPNNFIVQDTAFAFNYFTGWSNPKIERTTAFLIGNYKSFRPLIYVDYNHNLDFSDDGQPLQFDSDSTAIVYLKNAEKADAYFPIKLFYEHLNSEQKVQIESIFLSKETTKSKNRLVNIDYWMADTRMNHRLTRTWINGMAFTIGLCDYNCNGLYADKGADRIMIKTDENTTISSELAKGAILISDTAQIEIGNVFYDLIEVEPTGKFLKLVQSQQEYKRQIGVGDELSNFNLTLLSGDSISIANLQDPNKYLLLYFWGVWCVGCTQQLPNLIKLSEEKETILQVVGLNYGDPKKKIKKYLKEHQIEWQNGHISTGETEKLRIERFPNYILIDKNGEIIIMNGRLNEVQKELENRD